MLSKSTDKWCDSFPRERHNATTVSCASTTAVNNIAVVLPVIAVALVVIENALLVSSGEAYLSVCSGVHGQ